jgi:DNA-binding NtrC family response regulator
MYKILTVDDEVEICRIIDLYLSKKGYAVTIANSAEQALKLLDKETFDLLVIDKRMPGIGGKGLLIQLKEKQIKTPVIILTGSRQLRETTEEIEMTGYNDFLFKPIDLAVLLERVQKRIEESKKNG